MRKAYLTAIILSITLALTGCQPISMSNFTGQGTLATSDIVFPEEEIVSSEENNKQNEISENKDESKESNEDIAQKEAGKTNKKGAVSNIVLTGTADKKTSATKKVLKTYKEYQKYISDIKGYNPDTLIEDSLFNNYFLVAIPLKSASKTWQYYTDSVTYNGKLNITVLCEKDGSKSSVSRIIFIAVSKKDIPKVPSIKKINIKQNSYSIGE